ncbi:MAG: 2-dehydropantoate 2-reductase [Peptococcaceae bacterium]|jgi:2-dehydropantoate 2-reductase|nr:2-dehydropantoate 2-reductase [Peptococcaceae bacterium]
MKAAILGAGAMGSLVGAHLKKGGAEVYFIDVNAEHIQAVAKDGLYMEIEGAKDPEIVRPDGAAVNGGDIGVCDAVVLLVKAVNTAEAVETNKALFGKDTVILTLQNGLGNADALKPYFSEDIIGYGVLKASALLFAPGKIYGSVRFQGSSHGVSFAPLNWNTPRKAVFDEVASILTTGGMPAECTRETEAILWDKLYMNCLFNAIGALLQLANEDSAPHEHGKLLMEQISREICEVAQAKGFNMTQEAYWNRFKNMPGRTPGGALHYTSAVVDAYKKRPTEIDSLNGAICGEGRKLGIPTPYNETIWHLVHIMQDTYDLRYTPRED